MFIKKFAEVNGIKMCYEEVGEGKPIILIHGLTGNKTSMYPFVDLLGEGRKCIIIDTRGHGESDCPAEYKLEDHADDVAALRRALGYEKADVFGWSMGSYIALNTAEKYSDLIDHVVLLCTKPSGKTSSVEKIVTDAGFDMATIDPKVMSGLLFKASLSPEHFAELQSGKLKLNNSSGTPMSAEAKIAESRSLANFDLSGGYKNVTCKTLVVSGEYDGINSPELGKNVADGIGCEFVLIRNAGHMVPYEEPEALKKVVLDFLAR